MGLKAPLIAISLLVTPVAATAQVASPESAADLTADPRARSVLDVAMRCSIQRVADYINGGSTETAAVLGNAAIQYCYEKWKIAAAIRAKIGPEYGITLNSLDHLKIIEDSYFPGVTSAAVEFRMRLKERAPK